MISSSSSCQSGIDRTSTGGVEDDAVSPILDDLTLATASGSTSTGSADGVSASDARWRGRPKQGPPGRPGDGLSQNGRD